MEGVSHNMFVNMGETAVYFYTHHNYTINNKGAKAVYVRRGSSANKRCTVCMAGEADRTRLPLCDIFKGAVNGPIANALVQIMQQGCMAVLN